MLILLTAILVCKYTLAHATSSRTDDEVFKAVAHSHPSAVANLKILVQRHPRITRSAELIGVQDLMLLMKTTHGLHATLNEFGRRLSGKGVESLTKSQYAILLGALQVEFTRGEIFPRRLQVWIDKLTQWYPPEDPNWSHVPQEEPTAPEQAPPLMLMTLLRESKEFTDRPMNGDNYPTDELPVELSVPVASPALSTLRQRSPAIPAGARRWLKPEILCWGWNVMEEEVVRIPLELVDEGLVDGSSISSYLLYYPQL